MLATVKGYYNGSQIVLDTPVQFQTGQEVIITYTISQSLSKNHNHENIVDTLVGAIPDTGKPLAAYHSERLKKYASID